MEQAATAFEKIDGAVYPPSTGKNVSVIRLTSTQAAKLMDREQEVAEKHGRVNWEKLMERVLNNEDIDESPSTEQGAKGSSPASNVKRRLGGLEQITRQLQQRGKRLFFSLRMNRELMLLLFFDRCCFGYYGSRATAAFRLYSRSTILINQCTDLILRLC